MGNSIYSEPTSLMSDFTKIGFVAYSGIFLALDKIGLGRHQWDISLLDFTELNPLLMVADVGYCVVILLAKLPILLQYIRIFMPSRSGPIYLATQTLIWTNLLFYIAFAFAVIFQCTPRAKIWNHDVSGSCINVQALFLVGGSWNVLSDFAILILPVAPIWRLQVSRRKKIGISLVFGTGLFACIASVVRLVYNVQFLKTSDLNYHIVLLALWSLAEVTTVILCGNLLILPNFFKLLRRKKKRRASDKGYLMNHPAPGYKKSPGPMRYPRGEALSLPSGDSLALEDHSLGLQRSLSGGDTGEDGVWSDDIAADQRIVKTIRIQTRSEDGMDLEVGMAQAKVFD
ncbi:MAG: hypothetical protein LQ345_002217 [Seirophora villosa]|nr:MAG: hypothetical protein LQ345_002217 [Seirophora villosa]